jgi:tetratricopeptide (TPR) repeat protein
MADLQFMVIEFRLASKPARFSLLTTTLLAYVLVVFYILRLFVIGALTDDRVNLSRNVLENASEYFPNSPALQMKRASAELQEQERDLLCAEQHCLAAIRLSPHDYRARLLLGLIQEWRGEREAAEVSLRSALALAPNNLDVHWQLANLQIREGNLQEGVDSFRRIAEQDSQLLPAIFDLIWQASNHDLALMKEVAGSDSGALLKLSLTLLKIAKPAEASAVFQSIGRSQRLASSLSREFLDALVSAGNAKEARQLWIDLVSEDPSANASAPIIWNGSFESVIFTDLAQFDWAIKQSDYARLMIANGIAHSGSRSLKIEFSGRDTTSLDQEVNQLVLLQSGVHYRLECFARGKDFVSPEGPRVVVTSRDSSSWLASTSAITGDANEWQHLVVDFVAPGKRKGELVPVSIGVKRKPEFKFDQPTKGSIWLDDFRLSELSKTT